MKLTFAAAGRTNGTTFTPAAHGRVTVTVEDGGATIDRFEVNPASPRSRAQAKKYRCEDVEVIRLCDTAKTGEKQEWQPGAKEEAASATTVTLTIREFTATSGHDVSGPPLETLRAVLPTVPLDRLLVWTGTDAVCCLDVDYHDVTPPAKAHLETWVETRVLPKPVAWHFSRGGGLHLFYVATSGFTASELACAAAIRFRQIDPTAGVEPRKTQVRGPGSEVVHWSPPDTAGANSPTLGSGEEADDAAVGDYLATHGLEIGGRYPHERCPIDPTAATTATGDPVTVSPHGIYCHRCAGHGYMCGSRRAGFVPWTTLTGSPAGGDVGRMVRNKVHWGHAKWVLTHKYGLPEGEAREGYSAALRAFHGDAYTDAVKASVFHPNLEDMARSGDLWMNLTSGNSYNLNTSMPLLAALPASLVETDKGLKPVPSSVAYFAQGHDLSLRGYGNINVVHGFRMARQFLPPADGTQAQVLVKELRPVPSRHPKYVPKSKRKSVKWAEDVFLRSFPGLDFVVVRSLLCANGVAQETGLGLHPMIYLAGFTGAAKSSTCKIAAGILGQSAPEISYTKNEEKQKQQIAEAARISGTAVCNEWVKDSYRHNNKADARSSLEPMLTMTPEAMNHVMYNGPRRLGRIPAIVVTEPSCPYAIRDYHQIARRFRYMRLHGNKKIWETTFAQLGLASSQLHLFRLKDAELSEAADVILSDVIDTFFSVPMPWGEMADTIGLPTLLTSPDFDDDQPHLRRFFRRICSAPEITDTRLKKDYSAGYKLIHRNDWVTEEDQERFDLWTMFCDAGHDGWLRSERLAEKQWPEILGVSDPVTLDICSRGSNMVLVRFRVGPPKNPVKLNGDIAQLPEEPT